MSLFSANGSPVYSGINADFYFGQSIGLKDLHATTVAGQAQGFCIDDDGNTYTVLYHTGKILKYNLYTGVETVYSFTADAYGHANDATFNPNTGKVYVASMNATGEVYELDPANSMALNRTLYTYDEDGNAVKVWAIAYDRRRSRYITFDTTPALREYDNSFNLLTTKTLTSESLLSIWPTTRQGMETDGNFLYLISYDTSQINITDMGLNLVKVLPLSITTEPESMTYDWNTGMMFLCDWSSAQKSKVRLMRMKQPSPEAFFEAYSGLAT